MLNIYCFSLIAKWKKTGYEKLCCLRCIQTKVLPTLLPPEIHSHIFQDMNYQGSTCICRVPKAQVRSGTVVECVHCGTCLSFCFSLATEQSDQGAVAAAQTHRVPCLWDIINWISATQGAHRQTWSVEVGRGFGKCSCSVHAMRSIFVPICI